MLTCRSVLATRLSKTGPLSSCSRCTSSKISKRTIWDRATSPTLFLVTTSHFSGVVTNICKRWAKRQSNDADHGLRSMLDPVQRIILRLSAGCRVRIELLRNSLRTATNKPEDNHAMLPEMASEWETHKNLISYEATFPRHVGREWNTIEFYLKNFIYSGFTLMSHILGKHKYLIPISFTYCKAIKQHFKQKSTTIPNL